ncbi:MAG: p-cumate dioxygenase [Nocardioides sp.]|nr:p-cumate dioxygenase [Nocardioides sp.]
MNGFDAPVQPGRVVVVGGSTGGVRTVQALRRAGFEGGLVLLTDELEMPYDRPPLSKEVLASHDAAPVSLLTAEEAAVLEVDVRLGRRATSLDPAARRVTVSGPDGDEQVDYDVAVIATGATARTLPGTDGVAGVHVIRTLDDARAVRRRLAPGRRAVVVGAGFIGAEFASAAAAHDMHVTLVEAQRTPLAHALGAEVGAEVASVHEAHGARLLVGRTVERVVTDAGEVTAVVLDDGTELPADVVVVGIGARPATDWLAGSGLPLPDGVDCDEDLRVLGFRGLYAVGDVARWRHPSYPEPLRVEHWTNAGDHAQTVAAHLTGRPRPTSPLPYVWSDQYGHRLQIIGRPGLGAVGAVRGSMATGDLVAVYADDTGRAVGAVVVDDPRLLMKVRKAITRDTRLAELEQTLLAPVG